jgi:hypothetical protein
MPLFGISIGKLYVPPLLISSRGVARGGGCRPTAHVMGHSAVLDCE